MTWPAGGRYRPTTEPMAGWPVALAPTISVRTPVRAVYTAGAWATLVGVHGADQGAVGHPPGQPGQVLAHLDSGHVGGGRPELAAHLLRQVQLHVPHVQAAGAAV
jgi:hypothetical protein